MDQLTSLQGVAIYIYDILVSGTTASEHLQNLQPLLQRLESKGLHCCVEKYVECVGHILTGQWITPKVQGHIIGVEKQAAFQ